MNNFIKLFFILLSCLTFGQQSQELEEKFIKDFYVSYMNDNEIELSNYLTKNLINKIQKIQNTIDYSYITRSQDITNDMLKSLKVKPLSNKWYQVNYYSIFNKDTTFFKIPLKVSRCGHLKIVEIESPWNYSKWGCDKNQPFIEKTK